MCANFLGELGQLNRFSGRVRTATRHDGHMTLGVFGRLLHGHADDFAVFFHVDGG
jgi:hypothetical protein